MTTAPQEAGFPDLPGETPILFVHVARRDQVRCIRLLAALLGPSAELVHGPPGRRVSLRDLPRVRLRPQSFAAQADEAIWRGDLSAVRILLERGLNPNRRYGLDGYTALETAILHGRTAVARLLLSHAKGRLSGDPLSIAVSWGNTVMVQELIRSGARPNAAHLNLAAGRLDSGIVQQLLKAGVRPTRAVKLVIVHTEVWIENEQEEAEIAAKRQLVLRLLEAGFQQRTGKRRTKAG